MHPLFDYVHRYTGTLLSEDEFALLLSHFTYKKIRKKQFILQEGEVCKHFAFILKGAMRQFYVDDSGMEHVVNLSIENWWAGDQESYVLVTPSKYYIEAWEESEVLLITYQNKLKLGKDFPAFNELLQRLDERNTIASQKRITSMISMTAEQRYKNFLESYPYFSERFPNHIIASFIGVTKDTLSRIRKKAATR
ncbi:MAG: Crp/Fnr family transcriptional regulator [Flavihumibacter sp.]|jgi:CRP-like cAMP-binding protein|nr:Crp/Fnr family transcriptional regulator [Flavihumibacter sp.]